MFVVVVVVVVFYINLDALSFEKKNANKSCGSHAIHSNCRNERTYGIASHVLTGAIIPALMHRIPSELRCEACLGESSTRMGDLPGSPRVAPLFYFVFLI